MRLSVHILAFAFGAIFGILSLVSRSYAIEPDGTSPDLHIDRQILNAFGDPDRPVLLKVDVLKPMGDGPFPLVIYNHGAHSSDKLSNSLKNASVRYNMGVYYFLSRNYAVAMPQLRGYEGSGGTLPNTGCDLEALGRANAKDILASLSEVTKDPKIDATRIIVAGESLGGWNSLAVADRGDPRIRAAVNFHGGARSSACKASDRPLIEGARAFGKNNRVPSIWLYGDNDRFFSRQLWETMYRAYASGRNDVELVGYGKFGSDSHNLLSHPYGTTVFASKIDEFLKRQELPTHIVHPEFIPMPAPPVSGYASIDDIAAVPFMNDAKREAYRQFLKKPNPKAFVIAEGKAAIWSAAGFDPLASALAICRKEGLACRPYAFNNDVVWTYSTPQPSTTRFAALDDVLAVPYLNEAGRQGYRAFLKLEKPRAFVIAPDGYWGATAGTLDPTGIALSQCGQHKGCRPYAIDSHIVWSEERSSSNDRPAAK